MAAIKLGLHSTTECSSGPPAIASPLTIGQTISHYEILEKLGEGGMGVVYRALDRRLNRLVALKFLHSHSCEKFADLEKEALAISALNHPNIATIHGLEEAGEFKFLVLEYLPGGTLKSRIADAGPKLLPLGEALGYAIQIAEGLAHAHAHGVIHRDVKSSNILFSEQGNIKIADFSLASSKRSALDPASGIAGTPSSMSPEQAQGKEVDHRSDIFSTGILLFELITGRLPFHGPGHAAVLQQIISAPAPALTHFRPDIPPALESIVAKTLQKDPEKRYQRIIDLAVELKSVREQMESHAVREPAPETVTLSPATRKRRVVPVFGVVAFLAAASWGSLEIPWVRQNVLPVLHLNPLPEGKRLVVLNFTNAGENSDLCDGLMDVLSSKLTEMEQYQGSLLVISPSEVRRAEVTTPSEARATFGANLAITGTVQRHGDRKVVLMNLVDTATLAQLRSVTIDNFPDSAALQEGLVAKAGEMLDITLTANVLLAMQAGNTRSPAAYRYYAEGRGLLQRADNIDHLEEAVALFQQAIHSDPNYARAYAGIAEARLDQYNVVRDPKKIDDAFSSGSRAVELDGSLASVRVTMGRVLSARGRDQEAEQEFQKALQLDPSNAEAYRRLARSYQLTGRRKEAEGTYKKAIEIRPNDWRGYRELGRYYFENGPVEEAEPYYQRVLRMTPGSYYACNDLGATYMRMGQYADATRLLEKSVALKPLALSYSNLGTAYYLQGQFRDAARWYEKAVSATSTNASWWGNLADAYRAIPELSLKAPGAYRKAIDLGQRELTSNPRNVRLRSRVAYYYAAAGEKEPALREIGEAIRASNHDGYVLFRSAVIYALLHDKDAALGAIQKAVRAGYAKTEIRGSPEFNELRSDPRFASALNSKSP